MTDDKPLVRLWELHGLGLIISCPSGVIYSNQVDGYANDHLTMEGTFVPLQDEDVDQQTMLYEYFTGPKWRGHCYGGIDEETADFLDSVFALSPSSACLKVNREKLAHCGEAWIHVVITPEDARFLLFEGFSSTSGVATWENSD